jgi:hypothetical protein
MNWAVLLLSTRTFISKDGHHNSDCSMPSDVAVVCTGYPEHIYLTSIYYDKEKMGTDSLSCTRIAIKL